MHTRRKKNKDDSKNLLHNVPAASSCKKPRSRLPLNYTSSLNSRGKSAHSSCLIPVLPDYERCNKCRKRSAPEIEISEVFRRITRQQSRNQEEEEERRRHCCERRSELQLSGSSCVESTSVRGIDGCGTRESEEASSLTTRFDNPVCRLKIDERETDLKVYYDASKIQTFGSRSKSKAEESEGICNSEISSLLFPFTNPKTSLIEAANSNSSAFNFGNCQKSVSTTTQAHGSEGISRSEISSLDPFTNPEEASTVEEINKRNQNPKTKRGLNPDYFAFDSRSDAMIHHSIPSNSTINTDQQIEEPSICCFSVNSSANQEIWSADSGLICRERLSSVSCSSIDASDYSPSIWLNSESDFSEKSTDDSTLSPTFSLFLQYSKHFSSSTATKPCAGHVVEEEEEFTIRRFEEEEDEESYQRLRSRERREEWKHDYADGGECYKEIDGCADLVIQVRLQMVRWIIEQSLKKELHNETMFLAVNLLDRFFSKGFFKCKRSNQIVGIACLVLATRIEENQPHNSVRQKTFIIGENVYSRSEVIAMEWLVQRVLNFRCFLPTIHNFLWYYLKAAKADAEVETRARYLAMLTLLDHKQLNFWPSTIAAGLVMLSSLASNYDHSCFVVMETHVRTKRDDLERCIKSLEWLVNHAC